MQKLLHFAKALVPLSGLLLLGACAYLMWLLVGYFGAFLDRSNPSVASATIAAMATAFVGLASIVITQREARQRSIEEAHRQHKVEIYRNFLHLIGNRMAAEVSGLISQLSQDELMKFIVEYNTEVVLWGSPKVIDAHLDFKRAAQSNSNVLLLADALIRAIRNDLGLSNRGLNRRQLIRMYLKDPDEKDIGL